jgi:hypothetical protein
MSAYLARWNETETKLRNELAWSDPDINEIVLTLRDYLQTLPLPDCQSPLERLIDLQTLNIILLCWRIETDES